MSLDTFWRGDPDLFWAYRFSYLEKLKRNNETLNYTAWLQGLYFYEAVSVSLSQAFGNKEAKYSNEPYNLYGDDDKNKQVAKQNNILEEKIKARAKQIEKLLGDKKNE